MLVKRNRFDRKWRAADDARGQEVRTVSQAADVDLAEVQRGRHGNAEGALGNVISTVGHSNSQRALGQEGEGTDVITRIRREASRIKMP